METSADFEIRFSQFLDDEGNLSPDSPAYARDTDTLLEMYRAMVRARIFDAKAVNLQRTGKLGTYASCLGHEATHIGLALAMQHDDVLAPSYRETGLMLYRGVTMTEILTYWGGDERGSDYSGPRDDFPICVPIATQCLHAAGAGMAFKLRGEKRCAVSVNGDGGTSEGSFYEAINISGVRKLPVLFLVVNNRWAISMPSSGQTAAETFAQKAIAAGMPGMQVDGNDMIAVRHAAEQALARARAGDGPSLIEAITYRLSDHTTADDARRYRGNDEVETAHHFEPFVRTRKLLESLGIWDEEHESALQTQVAGEVDAAVQAYMQSPDIPIESMFDYLHAELPRSLEAQRQEALDRAAAD